MAESSDDEIQRGLTVRQSGSHVRNAIQIASGPWLFSAVILRDLIILKCCPFACAEAKLSPDTFQNLQQSLGHSAGALA
jgi:hypothetical protein